MNIAVKLDLRAVTQGGPACSCLNPTIYHEDWWLDLCGHGKVRHAAVERNGAVIAHMPYLLTRHLGLVTCSVPPLVHFSGPGFAPMDGPPLNQMQRRNDLIHDLLGQLPPYDVFSMKLHHGITDTLAFQREGFKTSVQFSFEIDPAPKEMLLAGIRRGHRRMIRDAETLYAVDAGASAEEFTAFYVSNIQGAGEKFRYDANLVTNLIEACLARGRSQLLLARDPHGDAAAGLFTIWDGARMYNFLGTRLSGRKAASASVLLLWAALQEASRRGLVFDFDGVFNAGQVQFFSGFGGRVTPRYIVSRATGLARLAYGVYGLTQGRKPHLF